MDGVDRKIDRQLHSSGPVYELFEKTWSRYQLSGF